MCHSSSMCIIYIMKAKLGFHSHFSLKEYNVSRVRHHLFLCIMLVCFASQETGPKSDFKGSFCLFLFSGYCAVSKVYSTEVLSIIYFCSVQEQKFLNKVNIL